MSELQQIVENIITRCFEPEDPNLLELTTIPFMKNKCGYPNLPQVDKNHVDAMFNFLRATKCNFCTGHGHKTEFCNKLKDLKELAIKLNDPTIFDSDIEARINATKNTVESTGAPEGPI